MTNKAMRNLINLKTANNDYRGNVGTYNGTSYFTVFSNNSNVPGSIWLSDTVKFFMRKYLKAVITNQNPSITNTIVVSRWNENSKTMDKQAIITIGTDEQSMIYLGVNIAISSNQKMNEEIINKDIKFPFILPNAVEISSETLTDLDKNKQAAMCVLETLTNKLEYAEAITNNYELSSQGNYSKPLQDSPDLF